MTNVLLPHLDRALRFAEQVLGEREEVEVAWLFVEGLEDQVAGVSGCTDRRRGVSAAAGRGEDLPVGPGDYLVQREASRSAQASMACQSRTSRGG